MTLRPELVGGGGEQDLGLEDETIADDGEVAPVAQHLPEPPEELGAVGGELLDLGGERHVEALAQVGDRYLLLLAIAFRDLQGLLDAPELRPERIDLLVEHGDLIALARAERAVLAQRLFVAGERGLRRKVKSLHLSKADFPLLQRALGEHRALPLVGEAHFELRRRVAKRGEVGPHGCRLVFALVELAPALDERGGHHPDLRFEIPAHRLQRVDVTAQALDVGEHDLDPLLAGLGPKRRLRGSRHRGLPLARHLPEAQLERVALAGHHR